jgi:DNA polymerase III gamma/tau subunit
MGKFSMMRDLDDLEDIAADLLMGRASGWDEALEMAPETKAVAEEGRDLAGLLSEIMTELREELVMFRAMRARAQQAMETEGEDHKTAKADAKAASEAIQQIVRTLEKLDSLQRTLAEERAAREEASFGAEAHKALALRVERLIEARARELAAEMRDRHEPGEARDGPDDADLSTRDGAQGYAAAETGAARAE